jgi:hypothetical protein
MKQKLLIISILVLTIAGVAGCKPQEESQESLIIETPTAKQTQEEPTSVVDEGEILEIPLPEPINKPDAEISGMDWYGDKLVLLPQYPGRFESDGFGSLFMIEKSELLDYISVPDGDPIQIEQIKFDDGGISKQLKGFEGFESIAFYGDQFYVTVETKPGASMLGYVYRGSIDHDMSSMTIEADVYQTIKPQAWFPNASEEAMLIYNETVFTFFEDYGLHKNNNPVVHKFDLDLQELGTIPMDQIEYRITDVTGADEEGKFWGMNYFFPGDIHLLPASDPIAEKFGEGETHQSFDPVERLVAFQITEKGINLLDQAPLQFRLLPDNEARNWEGLVLLDELGFLVVTDKFPSTILGFYEILR